MNENALEVVNANDPEYPNDVIVQPAAPPKEVPGRVPATIQHFENLVDYFDQQSLTDLGNYVVDRVDKDLRSRGPWANQLVRAIKLLGLGSESDPDASDYEDSDRSDHSLMLQAFTKFQASALNEMLPPDQVCTVESKLSIDNIPEDQRFQIQEEIDESVDRVRDFVNDYLLNRTGTYVADHDRVLYDTGLSGVGFKKIFMSSSGRDPVKVEQISAEDLIIAYDAVSMERGRITHRITIKSSDLIKDMETGVYRKVQVSKSSEKDKVTEEKDRVQGVIEPELSDKDTYTLYEMHDDLVLDDDRSPGRLPRPYVVTVDLETTNVLSVRRNWSPQDESEFRIEAFVAYLFHPGKSAIYGLGLGHLLSNITQALRTGQRRGLEAAYLKNHPVGLKSSSLTIRDDSNRMIPGEWADVDTPTGDIQKSFAVFPFQGVDQGLIQLMEGMEQNGKELAGTSVADIGELMKGGAPVGTVLALLDENSKFATSVHRRLYTGHKKELSLVQNLMVVAFGGKDIEYDEGKFLKKGDLESCRILPAMHPMYASRQRRIMEAQAVLSTAKEHPTVTDERKSVLYYYQAIGVDDADDLLVPLPPEAQPADMVTEYAKALRGEPLKSGLSQDHNSHIEGHAAQMRMIQSSKLDMQRGGAAFSALSAHIAEHMAQQLAVEIAGMLDIPMEALGQGIPPQVEAQVAPVVAQAMTLLAEMKSEPSEADVRIKIEEIRATTKKEVEIIKKQMVSKDVVVQEEGDTERNDADNETAMDIEEMRALSRVGAGTERRQGGLPATNHPVSAPTQDKPVNPRS